MLRIPYVGRACIMFKHKLTRFVKETFNLKLTCVFDSCKVKNYFSLKSKQSVFLSANLVYKFQCQSDSGVFYIGQTKRHLSVRSQEHFHSIKKSNPSAVGGHIKECANCRDKLSSELLTFENFEIVKQCKDSKEVETMEALFIKKLNPPPEHSAIQKWFIYCLKGFQLKVSN